MAEDATAKAYQSLSRPQQALARQIYDEVLAEQ
jgi:hypothetical protein